MKKLFLITLGVLVSLGAALAYIAARAEPTLRPNTRIGVVDVGGLTATDAARKLRLWWETERRRELRPVHRMLGTPLPARTPGKLGLTLDDAASVAAVPTQAWWDQTVDRVKGPDDPPLQVDPKFKFDAEALSTLSDEIRKQIGEVRPAQVRFIAGRIERQPEVAGFELDREAVGPAVVAALAGDGTVELPLKQAPKRVPDEALDQIEAVVGEFTTRFPARQFNRNTNIRLASGKLNGHILMPGERLSFNETVGRRTVARGYKEAGVYAGGRRDTGIGGGICQVSTTLYNASLYANLGIVRRQNHSMPVAYVPVGRDAAVDYGSIDLVIENTRDTPIAITSSYATGSLTFRVLGKADPGLSVKIVTEGHRSWDRGQKTVSDPALPAGARRVVEKGSRGHAIETYRLVMRDGRVVRRERLNRSHYMGGVRIIAVGSGAPRNAGAEAPSDDVIPAEEHPDAEPHAVPTGAE